MAEHNDLGKWGEDEAVLYLEDEGYTIVDRDWRLGRRDLDILAFSPDGNTLVVVEVKTRTGEEYQVDKVLRFDVISIVGCAHQVKSLQHLKDAFNPMLIL